ncbi:MAG TPA: TetR/AcrR family transcriptional regulator, partial [Acholeplasmataceae bacterium]|nr:TetR/AcrR family transcriptional regulator [Acholeplasmataceae bacterium]
MNTNKGKYRNYEKTEDSIKRALIELYRKKGTINKITVKELCEVANISRSTFYLHYNDLISIFESVGEKFVESLKTMVIELSKKRPTDFSNYFKEIFRLLEESSELIKIGLSSEYPMIYIERVKDQLEEILKNSEALKKTKLGLEQTLIEIRIVVSGMIDL